MNLQNMLRQLYEIQGKINYLTGAIQQALLDEYEYGTPVPVKAFEEHWNSMGKTVAEQQANYIAESQADGHAEFDATPFDKVGDATAYGEYRAAVRDSGPYYSFQTWKERGRPRD